MSDAAKGSNPIPPATATAITAISRSSRIRPGTDSGPTRRPVEVPRTVRSDGAVSTPSKDARDPVCPAPASAEGDPVPAAPLRVPAPVSSRPRPLRSAEAEPEEGSRAGLRLLRGAGEEADRADGADGADDADAADPADPADSADLAESADFAEFAEFADLAEFADRVGGGMADAADEAEAAECAEELERWRMPRPRPDSGKGIAAVRVPVGDAPGREPFEGPPAEPEPAAEPAEAADAAESADVAELVDPAERADPMEPAEPAEPDPAAVRFSPVQSWSSTRLTGIAPVVKRGSTPRWMASRIRATADAERGRLAGALASVIITRRRRSPPMDSGSSDGCCLTWAIAISTWLDPVKGR